MSEEIAIHSRVRVEELQSRSFCNVGVDGTRFIAEADVTWLHVDLFFFAVADRRLLRQMCNRLSQDPYMGMVS